MKSAEFKTAPRCASGVSGLDDILAGGFPVNRFYLIQGDPGVGKTTLALQFLLEGTRRGEKCLYITLSETKEELTEVANSHGWSLDGLDLFELSAVEQQFTLEAQNTLFHPAEVELKETTKMLLDEIQRTSPTRVVFDSLSEIRLLAQNSLRYRRQLLALKQFFIGRGCTVLLLDDGTAEAGDIHVQSLAHGVLMLQQIPPAYGAERRKLQIVKMRGVKFRGGFHDYAILSGGITVYPRLVANEHHKGFQRDELSSGIPALDLLLEGGITKGTSTLIIGPAGTGKSTIAAQFAADVAGKGKKALLYTFDEAISTLAARYDAIGMGFGKFLKAGRIDAFKVDPAELSPSHLAHRIRQAVESDPETQLVVIDSMNGYLNAMASDKHLQLQLHELLSYLNQTGIATILTMAQHGLVGSQIQTPADITYLADTVVILRYFEAEGSVRRAISVMKKRSGNHERAIREFEISKQGIVVGKPLAEFQGILSGVPVYVGSSSNLK